MNYLDFRNGSKEYGYGSGDCSIYYDGDGIGCGYEGRLYTYGNGNGDCSDYGNGFGCGFRSRKGYGYGIGYLDGEGFIYHAQIACKTNKRYKLYKQQLVK